MSQSLLGLPQWMRVVYKTYFDGNKLFRVYIIRDRFGAPWAEYYWEGRDLPYDAKQLKKFLKALEEEKK